MSKYIDADKLRAEIERRIKSLNKQAEAYIDADCEAMIEETRIKKGELRSLLSFLDTLENATEANEVLMGRVKAPSLDMESIRRRLDTLQEPEVDLEDEISNFIEMVDARTNGRWCEEDIVECAHHFAEWGAKNAK